MSARQQTARISIRLTTFVIGLSVALLGSSSAFADKFTSIGSGWQLYSNGLYGTEFEFPADVFTVAPAPASSDGRQFTSRDATLEIFATRDTKGETAKTLRRRLLQDELGYDNVTYAASGENWFVLSGFRGDNIFYEKYLLKAGVIHAFGVEFSASAKPFYAPIIERIEDSFRVQSPASVASTHETPRQQQVPAAGAIPAPERDPLVIY
jgi:hypothetical protein